MANATTKTCTHTPTYDLLKEIECDEERREIGILLGYGLSADIETMEEAVRVGMEELDL